MSEETFHSFGDFWPHYVNEHSKPATRLLHFIGTALGIGVMIYFVATGRWWLIWLGFIPGYGTAWIGHFFIEKNRPATFQHPLWSFMGDYKMIWLMLTGRMEAEVKRVVND